MNNENTAAATGSKGLCGLDGGAAGPECRKMNVILKKCNALCARAFGFYLPGSEFALCPKRV